MRLAPFALAFMLACNGITGMGEFEKVDCINCGSSSPLAAPLSLSVGR